MQITIAICTYNRDYILEKSVLAALAQDNALDYEVLVVDNNSTDNTALLIQGMVAGNPRLRPVKELRQGLSFARNRAVKESRGDYLVFVDDDAVLCPDYLKKLHKLLCRIPHPGAAGGPVSLGWMRPAPSWYEPGLDIWYNRLDHGTRRCFLEYPQILYGTNMVFSKEILERVGGFRTGLGRSGKGLGDSEDLEIMLRIAKAGLPVVYDPELLVTHYITPDRLSRAYLLEKARLHGQYRCMAELMHRKANPLPCLASWVLSLVRAILRPGDDPFSGKLIRRASWSYLKQWSRSFW